MTVKRKRSGLLTIALFAVVGMTFLAGCAPVDTNLLEVFARDLALNAAAALLL